MPSGGPIKSLGYLRRYFFPFWEAMRPVLQVQILEQCPRGNLPTWSRKPSTLPTVSEPYILGRPTILDLYNYAGSLISYSCWIPAGHLRERGGSLEILVSLCSELVHCPILVLVAGFSWFHASYEAEGKKGHLGSESGDRQRSPTSPMFAS